MKPVITFKKYRTYGPSVNGSSRESYKKFLLDTGRTDISFEVFKKVPGMIHEKMIAKLFSGRYKIRIPKLGSLNLLCLERYKKKGSLIDWGRYRKTGEYAPYRNSHTNGKVYKVHFYFYQKKHLAFTSFNFVLADIHKNELGKKIKNNQLLR